MAKVASTRIVKATRVIPNSFFLIHTFLIECFSLVSLNPRLKSSTCPCRAHFLRDVAHQVAGMSLVSLLPETNFERANSGLLGIYLSITFWVKRKTPVEISHQGPESRQKARQKM